jgi:hypothetical protein
MPPVSARSPEEAVYKVGVAHSERGPCAGLRSIWISTHAAEGRPPPTGPVPISRSVRGSGTKVSRDTLIDGIEPANPRFAFVTVTS